MNKISVKSNIQINNNTKKYRIIHDFLTINICTYLLKKEYNKSFLKQFYSNSKKSINNIENNSFKILHKTDQ